MPNGVSIIVKVFAKGFAALLLILGFIAAMYGIITQTGNATNLGVGMIVVGVILYILGRFF